MKIQGLQEIYLLNALQHLERMLVVAKVVVFEVFGAELLGLTLSLLLF